MHQLFFALIFLLLLCSCASSERMMRLTGDASAYSAPKADRLKGMESLPRLPQKVRSRMPGGEINLWPFFFSHRDYWNALWPMIDCDDYGFAVRPFYVQEGREKSILFPLTAWNNDSGWVFNTYWSKNFYGMAPFFHRSEKFSYYGPFWYKKNAWGFFPLLRWGKDFKYVFPSITYAPDNRWEMTYVFPCFYFSDDFINIVGPLWWNKRASGKKIIWGIAPLWYWNSPQRHFLLPLYYKDKYEFYSIPYSYKQIKDEKIVSILGPLYWHSFTPKRQYTLAGGIFYKGTEKDFKLYDVLQKVNKKNFQEHRFPIDHFCRAQGRGTVGDYAGFETLKKELAQKVSKEYYGVFPFFHRAVFQGGEEFDILKILYRQKKVDRALISPRWKSDSDLCNTSVSLPLFLSFYEKTLAKEEFISLLLMCGWYKRYAIAATDELMPFVFSSRSKSSFAGIFYRLWCNEKLKKYGVSLPEALKTPTEVRFYLDYLKYSGQIPRKLQSSGSGFFPLWHYSEAKGGYSFLLNCLLSGWGRDDEGEFRYVLPLLSWDYKNTREKSSGRGILFPLYKSSTKVRSQKKVVEEKQLHKGDFSSAFEYSKENWGLFLAFHEKGKFHVARKKFRAAQLEKILQKLERFKQRQAVFQRDAKIQSERERLFKQAAAAENFTLPDLRDLDALAASQEPLLKELGKLGRSQLTLKNDLDKLQSQLQSEFAALGIRWQNDSAKIREELLQKHTTAAEASRIRSLIFSSDRAPGFHQWRFLRLLLHSAKSYEKEHFSVLEFLFRYRKDGKRTSLLCFPFITVNEDEKSSEWSFLYRLFHFRNENGRCSGHIFFIPFGKR